MSTLNKISRGQHLNSTESTAGEIQNSHKNRSTEIIGAGMNRRLAEERNLLRSIVDNIQDRIYAKDLDGNFVVANESARKYIGVQHEAEILGTSDFDHFPKSIAARYYESEQRVIKKNERELNRVDMEINEETDQLEWFSTNKVPLRDTNGNVIGTVGCSRNITAQIELASKLRESRQRFRDFAESAADWFWECDQDFCVTYVSDSYFNVTGSNKNDFIGKSVPELVSKVVIDKSKLSAFKQSLSNHKPITEMEIHFKRTTGENAVCLFLGMPTYDSDNTFVGYRGVGRDITKEQNLRKQLSYQATHDPLTDLLNRSEFENRLTEALKQTTVGSGYTVLCYIDLDQFKIVNDTVGHLAGDQLLKQVSHILTGCISDGDILARIGGDEFGLLLHNTSLESASRIAQTIIDELEQFRFHWEQKIFTVSASIGLAANNAGVKKPVELLSNADLACYAAKDQGRNCVYVFSSDDDKLEKRHKEMLAATSISSALENGSFVLYMQAIADVNSDCGEIRHYETLLRMVDENGQLIAPGSFIPAAERFGLIKSVDRWVIRNALRKFKEDFPQDKAIGITINLSGESLSDTDLYKYIRTHLDKNRIDPSRICFEITETAVINNFAVASSFLNDISAIGCRIALDDFGSGLSSFAYLKHFKVDYLKIDGSFVRGITEDHTDKALVSAINDIAHVMGIRTVAEFVENSEIYNMLKEIGVDYAQGYGIAKPVPFSCPESVCFQNAAAAA